MDRKPWQNNGPHRASSFGSDRREGGRFSSDRRSYEGERSFRRFDRDERRDGAEGRDFGDRRRGFGDRREFGDRNDRRQSFGGDRRGNFGGDRRHSFGQKRREDFGVRSGPRARALETRRFSERSDFAKNAVVKLDADLADYFESAEAVNKALRMLVEASRLIKAPTQKGQDNKEETQAGAESEDMPVSAENSADAMFTDDDFEEVVDAVGEQKDDAEELKKAE